MELYFVSGNPSKVQSTIRKFAKLNIEVKPFVYDAKELDVNDIEAISKDKVLQAYAQLQAPCFVSDSGFYIHHYPHHPNYPGAFAKRSGISNDIGSLLKTMEGVSDRSCEFKDCLTFYDGVNFYHFYGISKGTLATSIREQNTPIIASNLWRIFIPDNCEKTLSEMTDEERDHRPDNRTSATALFADWYLNTYLQEKAPSLQYPPYK